MSCGRRIKYDHLELQTLHVLHNFSKRHGFVDAGNAGDQLLNEASSLLVGAQTQRGVELFGVDFGLDLHGVKVRSAVDLDWTRAELLVEGV